MSSADSQQQRYGEEDYQCPSTIGANHSKKNLQERIKYANARVVLLRDIKEDGEARLAEQAIKFGQRDKEIQEMKDRMEREIQMNDKALSDAALGVRSRDTVIRKLDAKHSRAMMAMQNHHKNKHQVVALAKKEVREELRAEREQREATLDIQRMSAGHSYNSSNNGVSSKDMGRRIPSSGTLFSRASTGGGSGIGAHKGGKARRVGK